MSQLPSPRNLPMVIKVGRSVAVSLVAVPFALLTIFDREAAAGTYIEQHLASLQIKET